MKKIITFLTVMLLMTNAKAGNYVDYSPDKDILAVVGDNLVIYVLDKADMKVTNRVKINSVTGAVNGLFFSKDGKYLWIVTFFDLIQYETATWTQTRVIDEGSNTFRVSKDHSIITIHKQYDKKIIAYETETGKKIFNYTYATTGTKKRVETYDFSVEKNELFLVFLSEESTKEEKIKFTFTDFKDLGKNQETEKRYKNDGKLRHYLKLNLKTGTIITEGDTWFSGSVENLLESKGNYFICGYHGILKFNNDNKFELMDEETAESYHTYFSDITNERIVASSTSHFMIYDIKQNTTQSIKTKAAFMDRIESICQVGNEYFVMTKGWYMFKVSQDGIASDLTPIY